MQVIVSSLNLYNYLSRCFINAHPTFGKDIIVEVENSELIIHNLSKKGIYIEYFSGFKEAKVNISYAQLKRFVKLLKLIDEQPIVLNLNSVGHKIMISEIAI